MTFTASQFNQPFESINTTLDGSNDDTGVYFSYALDVLDLISTTSVGLRTTDFTAPDDCQILTLHLRVINSVLVSKTITATLTAIAEDQTAVPDYLNQQTVSAALTVSTASTQYAADDQYDTTTTPVVLIKGVTYRLALTNSGASNVDRAVAVLSVRSFKRRQ